MKRVLALLAALAGLVRRCPDCGLPHDPEPCRRGGFTCDCCKSMGAQ